VFDAAKGVGDQIQPMIAASGSNYLVAWIQGAGRDVAGRIFNAGGLGTKKTLVNAAGNQNHPWLAASSNGGWHLVWADLRSGNNDVYAAHVSNTVSVAPVNGAVVAGGAGAQNAPTVSPLPNGKGYAAFLDQGNAKIRDLTAASAGTGPIRQVSLLP
jgi:hypothetical protein